MLGVGQGPAQDVPGAAQDVPGAAQVSWLSRG